MGGKMYIQLKSSGRGISKIKNGSVFWSRDPTSWNIFERNIGRIHEVDINIVKIYPPNIGAPKHIRKILEDFKRDIDSNTPILGDFNTPLSKMDRSSKQNINKDIAALNNVLDQMDLTDIYRNFIQEKQNTHSFKCTWNIFRHHMIGHKTSLKKFKKIEIISSIFSHLKGLKMETYLKEKLKNTQICGNWIACY